MRVIVGIDVDDDDVVLLLDQDARYVKPDLAGADDYHSHKKSYGFFTAKSSIWGSEGASKATLSP